MKIFMFTVLALAAAAAAPAEEVQEAPRDKRGIFGEPGGLLTPHLHHDSVLGSHVHAPLLSSSALHHHDLHDHAVLHDLHDHHHHSAPIITTSHAHGPLLHHDIYHDVHHDFHHDFHHDLHHDFHHDIHHSPLILPHHHHVAPVVRVVKTFRAPPTRHIIRSGW